MSAELVIDSVCGTQFHADEAQQVYEYHGQVWYFDSSECLKKFLEEPEKFSQPIE